MFDFDAGKLLIVGIIALIFIPPKDLPRVLRQTGQFVGKMRRMARDFQGQFMDAMREADMADLRREAQKLADSAKIDAGFDKVHDSVHDLRRDLEATPAALPAPKVDSAAAESHVAESQVAENHGVESQAVESHGEHDALPTSVHPV